MKELTNESHGDENYKDEIEPSVESHNAARNTIFDKLKGGDKDLREKAIKELIDNDEFWGSVFSIGANCNLDRNLLVNDSIRIGIDVFASIAEEVYDLSLKMEKELQQ